ncbi:hypothetical protein GIB67_003728 [Kingdonia uniflora]|uniref:GDSL esterase/lipase n=1 Tax=Kingdonia uniflora TaxID=39325 RepID=A0A7J7MT01_9MAGN|nr:hypothetical protein GIB67_003728 [Kingdonia uniflora]
MLSKQRFQSPSNAPEMEALSPNDVPVVLIDMHTCSLDSKIKMNLGFKNINAACCGAGHLNSRILCLQNVPFVCANRSEYVFWDSFHPSEATNAILSKEAYGGILQDI